MTKRSEEFAKFDRAMEELLKVPHSEIKKKLDAEKEEKRKRKAAIPQYRLQGPLPKICCPVCNADIDVSKAKYSEPLSSCHGQVVVRPVPGTLVGIVDFCTSPRDNES